MPLVSPPPFLRVAHAWCALISSAVWLRCGALRTPCWTPSSSGAGGSCGICLQLVDSASCPTALAGLPDCAAVDVGGLCSSDNGECGTDVNADNCNPLGRDVYRRFDCAFHPPSPPPPPAPQTPPSPPSAPFPDCASCDAGALTSAQSPGREDLCLARMCIFGGCVLEGEESFPLSRAGSSCGICLMLVDESECPVSTFSFSLPPCDFEGLEVGEQCDSNSNECGTNSTNNNCGGEFDVYVRVACANLTPPSLPSPPAPPPPLQSPSSPPVAPPPLLPDCSSCDAGTPARACQCGPVLPRLAGGWMGRGGRVDRCWS